MADKTIDIPGVGPVDFPDSMSDAQMNAAATRLYQNANVGKKQPPVTSWTDRAVSALPAVGATAGGIIGGIGGTVAGMGVGGVPGAAGGAGLGGAAGEAAKQLINRARGSADAPQTSGDAALAIGKEGAIDAAGTAAMGALGSKVVPAATTALMDYGTSPTVAKTGASIGKAIGAVAPAIAGGAEAGPMGVIAGLVGASKGAWLGGKTGWFTAKLTQDMARPIASILSNATGLAPAAIAETLAGLTAGHAIQALIGAGVPIGEATRVVANAKVKAEQN